METTAGILGMFGVLGWLIIVILGLYLLILAILTPYFIYRIHSNVKAISANQDKAHIQAIVSALNRISDRTEASSMKTDATNQLLRQLIRAYGHGPEA
jgi:uncharacterized membrane protein